MLPPPLLPLLLLLLAASTPRPAAGHWHYGYNHETGAKANHVNWLSTLKDECPLGLLSLPGTHETMALYGGDSIECQVGSRRWAGGS